MTPHAQMATADCILIRYAINSVAFPASGPEAYIAGLQDRPYSSSFCIDPTGELNPYGAQDPVRIGSAFVWLKQPTQKEKERLFRCLDLRVDKSEAIMIRNVIRGGEVPVAKNVCVHIDRLVSVINIGLTVVVPVFSESSARVCEIEGNVFFDRVKDCLIVSRDNRHVIDAITRYQNANAFKPRKRAIMFAEMMLGIGYSNAYVDEQDRVRVYDLYDGQVTAKETRFYSMGLEVIYTGDNESVFEKVMIGRAK